MTRSIAARARAFGTDKRGTSAVEFALVSVPFILTMLMTLQLGIFYMAQSSLDSGVIYEADQLVKASNGVWVTPTASALKTAVFSKSGGLIRNDSTFCVELVKFSSLNSSAVAVGNTVATSASGDVLALRALATIPSFVPWLGVSTGSNACTSSSPLVVRSAALVRRLN